MIIVTRFAPSPSGRLHIGGARTALFNYLFAKSNNGIFKVRIEDTDKERESKSSINSILEDLNWLEINTIEKIIYQSQNKHRHLEVSKLLVENDLAYRCFLSYEEIEEIKENKKFESPWRNKNKKDYPKNKKFVIRMKIPKNENIIIDDLIQGKINVNSNELDDYVIVRGNGEPTFLLSSAVDDIDMEVSHIIRGDDHLTNTFRQSYIYKFLAKKDLYFAHLPLIHNEKGQKLSKRDGVTSINQLKDLGYMKEAIVNYLLRLGWSYKNQEIFSINEATKLFKLKNIGKSPAKIDEKKINYLNSYYLKNMPINKVFNLLKEKIQSEKIKLTGTKENIIKKLLKELIVRSVTINELFEHSKFIYMDTYTPLDKNEKNIIIKSIAYKKEIISILSNIIDWKSQEIEKKIKDFITKKQIPFKFIGQPLRLLITHRLNSPSIVLIMEFLGKNEVIKRLNKLW